MIIIWLYIALNRTPNIDCYWVRAVPNLNPRSLGLSFKGVGLTGCQSRTLLGGSWALGEWANNGDNLGCYMVYRGHKYTHEVPSSRPSIVRTPETLVSAQG